MLTTRAVAVTSVIPDFPFGLGKRYKLNINLTYFFWIPSSYLHMPLGHERAVILYLIWVIVQVYCLSLHQTCSHSLLVKVISHPTCWTCCQSCQPLHSQCPNFGRITCSVKVDQKVCSWREEKGKMGKIQSEIKKSSPLRLHRYRVFFKGEVRQKKFIGPKFLSDFNWEKFQKAILTEKPRSQSKIKLKGPKLTK